MACRFLIIKTGPSGKEGSPPNQEYKRLCALKMESEEQKSIIHQILVKKGVEHYITDDCPFAPNGNWSECPYNYDLFDLV